MCLMATVLDTTVLDYVVLTVTAIFWGGNCDRSEVWENLQTK